MLTVVAIVFVSVFAVACLLMVGTGSSDARDAKQALASLDSALAGGKAESRDAVGSFLKNDSFSAVPWINSQLRKIKLAPRLQLLLTQANLKWSVGSFLLGSAVLFTFTAYLANWKTASLIFSFLVGSLFASLPFAYALVKRARRFEKFEEELPAALTLIVSALRVGHSLNAALGLIARESPQPLGGEFKVCFEEQNFGLELRTAMENLIIRVPLKDLRIVVTAILIQKESGGNLAEVLNNTAHVIRERFRLKRQVRTHTAQGRLTGWILSFLPVALGFALYFVNPDAMRLLWTREIGIKLLYAATGMIVVGSLIIRKIVKMEV